MGRYGRDYVPPGGMMFRVFSWHSDGRTRSAGPYATEAAARRMRKSTCIRGGLVEVQFCHPEWLTVEGTEL